MPRRNAASGAYVISSPGITERIDASAETFGAALSKANTLGVRLQRELRADKDEEDVTLTVSKIGDPKALARITVTRTLIITVSYANTK